MINKRQLEIFLVIILLFFLCGCGTIKNLNTSNKIKNSGYEIIRSQKVELRDSVLDNIGLDTGSYHFVPSGIAGVKDQYTGDRPLGYAHRSPDYVPEKPKVTDGLYSNIPSPKTQRLRDKLAARRAKKNLKLSQKISRSETQLKDNIAKKAESEGRSSGCFPPDTLVIMGDGTYKPFSKIQIGDVVLAYDIGYEKTVAKPVIGTYSVKSNHLYTINNELITTGGERVLTQTGWKEISELEKDDFLFVNNQMTKITSIKFHRKDITLYNMQVDDTHNFYIMPHSDARYLVHNSGGGGK